MVIVVFRISGFTKDIILVTELAQVFCDQIKNAKK
jgi:hypothetical protein|tara:strand:+ start:962 stop:1066 length:105 start_codon:yes stop_codon:yes gene_type:complete